MNDEDHRFVKGLLRNYMYPYINQLHSYAIHAYESSLDLNQKRNLK